MECMFCKIAQGTIRADTVYEDEQVRVFKDIHPKAPVHLLVVPKTHIESVAHLEKEHGAIAGHLLFTAKEVAVKAGLKGYKLVFNVGREGGQSVNHLHLHILGGWSNNEGVEIMN